MLTFEEKLTIIESFPELKRNDISLGRVNFHYEESIFDKKIVVYHLHPNGNGFVYAENIDGDYQTDQKGMTNIRDFTEEELRTIITQAIASLSEFKVFEEAWINSEKQILTLIHEYDTWDIYAGDLLDGTYASYNAAADYLQQEGFRRVNNEDVES
ncbi:hypothetical protein [Oceanobacillus bengalensis]|uniref:Uncharacterized protein n=1 Tax=Oceanobacillus bengalensis TaxID=1435466 RepID=A0A494Z3T8_9BACI|nr:hypothetical protein [Oceanobacillus bengalensis]RKQ17152.1 hypothetical protein D8M05_05675 [Oceanobacillus bengalensis]